MRPSIRLVALIAVVAGASLAACPPPARSEALRLVAADDGGVTFRVDLPPWSLAPDPAGTNRSRIEVAGLGVTEQPGRPHLPTASTLIALPPGARAVAQVIAEDGVEIRENVALTIAGRPAWVRDAVLGTQPTIEDTAAILDGPWPRATLEVGEPFTVRRQRMVAVRTLPFRYDEATGRLWATRSLTVRVSFVGARARASSLAPAPEDRHFEPVLEGSILNYEQGRRFRVREAAAAPLLPSRPGSRAALGVAEFDESEPEVRVRIDSTAVHLLLYEDLAANGYPAGVPVSDVSVHRHEFVENSAPPYVTLELPCEVLDFGVPNVFDEGDAILVYAQNWGDRARPSVWQRMWGVADYLYVTRLTTRPGLRVGPKPGWRDAAGLTPLASYPQTTRYERNTADPENVLHFLPDTLTDPHVWVIPITYYLRPDSIQFTATDLDTSRGVRFSVAFIGTDNNTHWVWASVRNALGQRTTVVDSANFVSKASLVFGSTVFGSSLTEGVNAFTVFGKTLAGPPDPTSNARTNAALNWFEVVLWRSFRAIAGYLPFGTGDASGAYQVRATGFRNGNVRVYDVTDSVNVTRLDIDPSRITQAGPVWTVEFQDSTPSAGQPRRYVAFDTGRLRPPEAYSPVVRRDLTAAGPADYLLVTPEAFLPAANTLADLRRAQGLSVLVAPYESIRDEFNGGRSSAHAIKRFVRWAYNNWDSRFLLLLGDASAEDPARLYPTSMPDWLPTMQIRSPIAVSTGGGIGLETIPSDAWYVWCVDPACIDPSLQPKLHDLFVGRLPVNSLQQATDVVAKLAAYENLAPDQTWRREMVLHADDQYSGESFGDLGTTTYCKRDYELRFLQLNQRVRSVVLGDAGLRQCVPEVFDQGAFLASEPIVVPTPGDTCRPDRGATQTRCRATVTPALVNRLNAGRLWWNYQGHANEHVISHEGILNTFGNADDWRLFTNSGRPFLFSAFSCHANHFGRIWESNTTSDGPCLGEEMVVAPSAAAVASWASSGFEIIPSNGTQHINVEFAKALFSNPPRDPSLGDGGARVVLGEAIAKSLMTWFPQVPGDPYQREVGITYVLLGDPATRLSIGAPQAFVLANGDTVQPGIAVRLHTPGDTLRLVADLVSNVEIASLLLERERSGVRDTVPSAAYVTSPAFPDTLPGGSGGRRYQVSFGTSLTPEPHTFTFRTLDRNGVGSATDVLLPFQTVLRAGGAPVADGDDVSPGASLTLLVLSPAPIADPLTGLALTVNGTPQAFQAAANPGDASGREWILSWTGPTLVADYVVGLTVAGAPTLRSHRFGVSISGDELKLADAMLFPNPFEDDLGAFFSFTLQSGGPADVLIRVYTVSGRLVYRRAERGLAPGYHQLPWDGRDAEGDKLANGVYFYRIEARNASAEAEHLGRLVKLRKPYRAPEPATP